MHWEKREKRKKGRKRKTMRIGMFFSTFPCLALQYCQLLQVPCNLTSRSKGIREILFLWPHLRIMMVWGGGGGGISYLPLELEEELILGHQKPPRHKKQGYTRCHSTGFLWGGQGGGFGFVIVPLTTQDIRGLGEKKKSIPPIFGWSHRGGGKDKGIFGKCRLYI